MRTQEVCVIKTRSSQSNLSYTSHNGSLNIWTNNFINYYALINK
jgi:hypothetical protein